MAVKKLSQIALALSPPLLTDTVVGVGGGASDLQYTLSQIVATVDAATGTDPLFLTQGFDVAVTDVTWGGDATFRRAAEVTATYDNLNSTIGFTDQVAQSIALQFNAGYNQYGGGVNIDGKYTPIALDVFGQYYGAGEKFLQTWTALHWSMGDSFLFSAAMQYAGGPINGDEGQGFTAQEFYCSQPFALALDTINAVIRTSYSSTVTANVGGSYIAQAIPVASTVGANVDDWVILNQEVMAAGSRIWAMKIVSVQPGVSITGVCAINLLIGDTVKPALCLNLDGGAQEMGEGRVLINTTGASYSTGLVVTAGGSGSFLGSGTTWTAGMVGGDALNVGSIWLTVDDLSGAFSPFGASTLHSVYQITRVNAPTSINIFSFSVAGDVAYHGRGEGATNLAYKIVPSARVLRREPQGSGRHSVICEYSAHTWNIGDVVECVVCPYPDVHGFDFSLGEFTAGGIRRGFISCTNIGARTINSAVSMGAGGGFNSNPLYDTFAFATGVVIGSCQVGVSISRLETTASNAIQISAINDAGTVITMQHGSQLSIGINSANAGYDFTELDAVLRTVGNTVNPDTVRKQLVWSGYFQIADNTGTGTYLRLGGAATGGASINGTGDLLWKSDNWQFLANLGAAAPYIPFEVDSGGVAKLGVCNSATVGDLRATLDPTNLTAARTVKFLDTGGDFLVAAANTTGGGSALLGANSPAVTNTAPYTWLQMLSHDGSTVYVPAWK